MNTEHATTQNVLQELNLLASRLSRLMRQSETELPYSQRSILSQLLNKPRTIGQLASLESLSAATVSRAIDRLEDKNLVWRARDKNDRRIVYVVATREAVKLMGNDAGVLNHQAAERLTGLTQQELTGLLGSLLKLNDLFSS